MPSRKMQLPPIVNNDIAKLKLLELGGGNNFRKVE